MNSEPELLTVANMAEADRPATQATERRLDTKEIHVRVSIPNYQYLDQVATQYGMRTLSAAVNFLIEFHRQSQSSPTLGRAQGAAKQAE